MKIQSYKKLFSAIVAYALCLAMVFTVQPLGAFAAEFDATDDSITAVSEPLTETVQTTDTADTEPTIIKEIESKRDANTKHFLLSDGSYMAAQYDIPVHFKDETGVWEQYDNSLQEDPILTDELVNKKSDTAVSLSKKSKQNKLASVNVDGYEISWGYEKVNNSPISYVSDTQDNLSTELVNVVQEAWYYDVYNGVDLQYFISPYGIKENIVLNNKNTQKEFYVNYKIDSLSAVHTDYQTIELRNAEGVVVYTIKAPVMTDAAENTSDAVCLEMVKTTGNGIRVKISASEEWLNSDDRIYPVTVDPWVEKEGTYTSFADCFLIKTSSGDITRNTGAKHLYAGITGSGINRSFIKLTLPTLGEGDVLTKGVLSLNALENSALGSGNYKVDLHMLTSDWTVQDVTFDHIHDTNVLDYCLVGPTNEVWHSWDITRAVKYWYSSGTNYGLMMKGSTESGIVGRRFCGFKSSVQAAMPVVRLYYSNMTGLNDYNSYKTYDYGSYGTLSLNEYRGSITYIFSDVAYSGNLLNTNIYHVYNSDWVGDSTAYGKGWKLNISEKVTWVHGSDGLSSEYHYRYTDEDGTDIYFKATDKTDVFEDEVGRGWTLTYDEDAGDWMHTLEDKAGNKKAFDYYGRLRIVKDSNGNEFTISYDGSLPISITDSSGRVTQLKYENGYLSQIIDPAGRTVNYVYDSNGYLVRAERYEGITPEFTMSNSRLYRASLGNSDLVIKYHSNGACQSLATAPKNSDGNRFLYWEKINESTRYITHLGPSENIGAEDRIYEVCLFNEWGQKTTSYLKKPTGEIIGEIASATYKETEGNVKNNNKIERTLSTSAAVNLLPDGSFENGSWLTSYKTAHTDTAAYLGIEANTENAYIGQDAARITYNSPSQSITSFAKSVGCIQQDVTYTLSGYVRTENVDNGNGAFMSVTYRYINGAPDQEVFSEYVNGTTEREVDNGWKRISMTFTVPSETLTIKISLGMDAGSTGTVWFDCIQLEEGDEVSDFNLIENAGFEENRDWNTSSKGANDGVTYQQSFQGYNSYTIVGDHTANKNIYQTIDVYGSSEDVYILSAWAKGSSLSHLLDDERRFALEYSITYTDGTVKTAEIKRFNEFSTDWQQLWFPIIVKNGTKQPKSITVYLEYYKNQNNCYFDNVQLMKDKSQSYVYDQNGNVTNAVSAADQSSSFEYSDNEVVKSVASTGHKYYNTYSSTNKHLLISSYADGISYQFDHDSKGNVTGTTALSSDIVDGGVYALRTAFSNGAVDVRFNETADGTLLLNCSRNSADNQKFRFEKVDGTEYYTIHPCNATDKILEVSGSGTADGTRVCLGTYTGAANQQFKLVANGKGTYRIVPRHAEDKCWDTWKPTSEDSYDAYIEIWGNTQADSKGFVLELLEAGDSTLKMQSSATYTASGQYTDTVTDTLGNTVDYDYNETKGELTSVTDARGNKTSYINTYGAESTSTVFADTDKDGVLDADESYARYFSSKGLLDKVENNNNTYSFTYDIYGNRKKTLVGDRALIENFYNDNNGRLNSVVYGNGDSIQYTYDELNRISEKQGIFYGDPYIYRYEYDKKGNIASFYDDYNQITTNYTYDSIGRLVSAVVKNGLGRYQTYDAYNRISKLTYTYGSDSLTYRYNYNDKNLIGSVALPTGKSVTNSYDALNRLVSRQIGTASGLNTSYTYKNGINGTTSALVDTVTTAEGVFSYTYDANGNILTISKNGILQESYTYDELNQLKTVTRGSDVYEYNYDNGGNILSVKLNGTVTDTYTYGDDSWGDLLTSYNGQTITYDEIGNPLQYRDGIGFSWDNGRFALNMYSADYDITFITNADGYRIVKNVFSRGIKSYEYEYNGSLLVRQKWGNNTIWFLYDESGSPVGFTYNGTEYYYLKNVQGDITGITDANGNILAKYTYDVWGKILAITDANGNDVSADKTHIANINPLRYRGYYYDTETGFYYLLSRYYDPVTGRFVNADGYVSTGQGFTGFNMFAYCGNNPVSRFDPMGSDWREELKEKWESLKKGTTEFFSDVWDGAVDTYNRITSVNQQQQALDVQIRQQQNEIVSNAGKKVWDAYQRGYNIQQETQLRNAEAIIEGVKILLNNPEETIDLVIAYGGMFGACSKLTMVALVGASPVGALVSLGIGVWGIYRAIKGFPQSLEVS